MSKTYHVSAVRLLKVKPFVFVWTLKLPPPPPEQVPSLISMFVAANPQYRNLLRGYDVSQRSYAIPAGLNLSWYFSPLFPIMPYFPYFSSIFSMLSKSQLLFSFVFRVESYLLFISSALSPPSLYVSCFLYYFCRRRRDILFLVHLS